MALYPNPGGSGGFFVLDGTLEARIELGYDWKRIYIGLYKPRKFAPGDQYNVRLLLLQGPLREKDVLKGWHTFRDAFGLAGKALFPMFVDYAPLTHMVAGHPVVADAKGKDLFIQVTKVHDKPHRWHVSVNNPTDAPVTAKLSRAMDLPGLKLAAQTITFKPGEYRVLE